MESVTLGRAGLDRAAVLPAAFGCYGLPLPGRAWVDIDEAHAAVHAAEGALRRGQPQTANGHALVASIITRRPFLPAEFAPWVEARRGQLAADRLRALDSMVQCLRRNGKIELAEQRTEEAIALDPYRETGYQPAPDGIHLRAVSRSSSVHSYPSLRTPRQQWVLSRADTHCSPRAFAGSHILPRDLAQRGQDVHGGTRCAKGQSFTLTRVESTRQANAHTTWQQKVRGGA